MTKLTKSALASALLQIATAENGVRESGPNTGAKIRKYQDATTLKGTGWPWCAAFVAWVIRSAELRTGVKIPWTFSASCDVIFADLKARGLLRSRPEPGDVFLVRGRTKIGYSSWDAIHIGFVTRVQGDFFWTIEGNTNNDGGREGVAVMEHKRKISSRFWFGRVVDGVKEFEAASAKENRYAVSMATARGLSLLDVQMDNGTTLVAARDFANALGREIAWDSENGAVIIGGEEVPLQPRIFEGRAFFPVRELARVFELKIGVNIENRQVVLTS